MNKMKAIIVMTLVLGFSQSALATSPVQVKVFVGAMFEIGENSGDNAGEFQHWYQRYFVDSPPITVKGALHPVYCNSQGICGAVLGMGKVSSSASMQAILLDPRFDFQLSYFLLSGVGGTPPTQGTIGDVSWGTWLIDFDLGHRWSPTEEPTKAQAFMPRKGYEAIRCYQLNADLVNKAVALSANTTLLDSAAAQAYRQRYPQTAAQRKPGILVGTHMTGDTFFHGPGLSAQAQYIAKLYGADDYVITEMEAAAITQVLARTVGTERILSLRGAVNFDQGNPQESTLAHLDPAPGQTAGGFAETVQNIVLVGSVVVDDIVNNWQVWR
jgi:purine nucleoside permease